MVMSGWKSVPFVFHCFVSRLAGCGEVHCNSLLYLRNLFLPSKFLFHVLIPALSNFISVLSICVPVSLLRCRSSFPLLHLFMFYIATADVISDFYQLCILYYL
jgi:hypothetical protein